MIDRDPPWRCIISWPCTADELRKALETELLARLVELRGTMKAAGIPPAGIAYALGMAAEVGMAAIEESLLRALADLEASACDPGAPGDVLH